MQIVDPRNKHRIFRRSIRFVLDQQVERDPTHEGHPERVGQIVGAMAGVAGLSRDRTQRLIVAAHLHDVGKVAIPDDILLKPAALTEDEYEVVKRHSKAGATLVSAGGLEEIATWIRAHHERWDGAGYPMGLAGDRIPLEARILAVADALDAMTAERCYRSPLSTLEAARELERCAGEQFDPELAHWLAEALRSGELELESPPRRREPRLVGNGGLVLSGSY